MKCLSVLLLTFISISVCYAQKNHPFEIKEIVDSTLQKKSPTDFIPANSNFFEDEDYLVSKTCSGEWGGTVKFKSKKTGIEYSCRATCSIVLNKISGKYIISNTLAHLIGSTNVIEIEHPDSLDIFKQSKPRKKDKTMIRYVGDDESKSTKGCNILVDSLGVLLLNSFPYGGELFHVIAGKGGTFLAKIQDHKFVTLDMISEKHIWTYDPVVIKTADNRNIVFFENSNVNGYLEVLGNKITLTRYK